MQRTLVLLVDDDEACLDSLKRLLDVHGYHVETANDGATALALAHRAIFHLIISDFEMPEMDGIDLFLRIRHVQPDIEGILFTGALTDMLRTEATSVGMLAALNKTCDWTTLLQLVESISPRAAGAVT